MPPVNLKSGTRFYPTLPVWVSEREETNEMKTQELSNNDKIFLYSAIEYAVSAVRNPNRKTEKEIDGEIYTNIRRFVSENRGFNHEISCDLYRLCRFNKKKRYWNCLPTKQLSRMSFILGAIKKIQAEAEMSSNSQD